MSTKSSVGYVRIEPNSKTVARYFMIELIFVI